MKDPLLGRRFGSYVVEHKLGQGGMGSVYRAIQPEIGKPVAIKFLSPELAESPNAVERFFAEARAVNLIQHDNIVDIFDFGREDGWSYFVMELLRGSSLEQTLGREGTLPVGRAVDIALQIADAITAAHARGIIHRDLKPDNVVLVAKIGRLDFVKLLDFGIAKLTDPPPGALHRTLAGAVLGTPGYMSPEQGTGGAVDGRTDVYALGVILYRMLAGRLPFLGASPADVLAKQLSEAPEDLRALRPDVPPALAALVHQMILRPVEARPGTMAEVLARLTPELPEGYLRTQTGPVPVLEGGAPASATTLSGAAGQKVTVDRPPGRRRRARWAAGAVAVVLVAAGAWGLRRRTPAPAPVRKTAPAAPRATFQVFVTTDPPGATISHDGRVVGQTPARVTLPGPRARLSLHLDGYHDSELEVDAATEQAFDRLGRLEVERPRPARPKRPAIGLND